MTPEEHWDAVAKKGSLAETCACVPRAQESFSLVDRRDSTRSLFFARVGASCALWVADSF